MSIKTTAQECGEALVHLKIDGKPYMLENRPLEGLAVGANPIAPRSGGAGPYNDYTLWNLKLLNSWDLGVGWEDAEEGGFLYAEADTRYRGKIMLPPKVEYEDLGDAGDCDCQCHFNEACDSLWMARGRSLYRDGELVQTFDECITGIQEYYGYMLVAHGDSAPFSWYSTEEGTTGTGPYNFNFFYIYAGLLYGFGCNSVRYTAGLGRCSQEFEPGTDLTPSTDNCVDCYDLEADDEPCDFVATPWCWSEEIQIGPCDPCCCITGAAGMINGTFSQQLLYISTCDKLYALFPGDIPVHIADWPAVSEYNGVGAVNHFGNIYMPVGNGLVRIATNGDLIFSGINRGEGLPCDKAGQHVDQISTPQYLLSAIQPNDPEGSPSLWASANDAWHFIACFTPGTQICGTQYSAQDQAVYVCLSDGTVARVNYPSTQENPIRSDTARFESEGYVDLGIFYGGYRELEKYFHAIYIDGDCIGDGTSSTIEYATDEDIEKCLDCREDATTWRTLGEFVEDGQEIIFCDNIVKTKRLRLRLRLNTTDDTRTPVIRAIRIKYLPRIVRQVQFSYGIHLPKDCLLDMKGVEIVGYNQDEWDCCIRKVIDGGEPVHFVDIDDREYRVIITDFSMRRWDFSCEGCEKRYDISYYLTLLQVDPESIDCGAAVECDSVASSYGSEN